MCKKGDLIKVTWIDADDEAGWQPDDEAEDGKVDPLFSYGLMVSRGPKFITLSYCRNEGSGEWLGKHRIPLAFIIRVETLQTIEEMPTNND